MRPSEVLRRASSYLERHDVQSPRESAELLLAHVLGTDRAGLFTRTRGLTTAEARAFGRALCQRCTGVPVQHLTGRQSFRRLELEVRPGVFVPRPETEVVVDVVLDAVRDVDGPVVVDAGTGTGVVALSRKDERSDAAVFATDLSPEAVALAADNAARTGLEVTVLEGDLLSPLPDAVRGHVAVVVSNPPYITSGELPTLPAEVLADPELALVGGTDVHERLVRESPGWLRPAGALVVEIGAEQGSAVRAMFEARFQDVRVVPDLAGRDRVVFGRLP
jgi:release factor glutamine methyltransferase